MISRLKGRDPDALAALIEAYKHRLYRYLLRFVRNPATAEDLFQLTWLRVVETLDKFDDSRSFEPWLFRVAHNITMDYLRSRQPESLEEPEAEPESGGLDALDRCIASERAEILLGAMSALPACYREVLSLRFEEAMKLEEIARVVNAPLPTVKTRLRRALLALRSELGAYYERI